MSNLLFRISAKKRISFLMLMLLALSTYGKGLSPYQFGLAGAKSGEERFWVIYNTHVEAINQNTTVDYTGIQKLVLEIPSDAKSIPLSNKTDFSKVNINVKNTKKDNFVLFVLTNKVTGINIDKNCFISYDFRTYPELRSGYVILIVEDTNPWVENRKGFNYGAIRKDILLLRDGVAINRPICPYDNEESSPKCNYAIATTDKKVFKNMVFNRDTASTVKTLLFTARNINNIEVKNVSIHTPKNDMLYGDQIILFEGCTNVLMKDVYVDNTYSQIDKFGYAFGINPAWNVRIENVRATAEWGVFACSNLNKATLKNCQINRFDLHCYGKDYYLKNCTITGGMPISSMFGKMQFDKCVFDHANPCNYRYDYNSYTPFDLIYKNCVFKMDQDHNFILYISQLSEFSNSRKELEVKCLPNLYMKKCIIESDSDVTNWDVIHIGRNYYPKPLGYISNITIDGLKADDSSKSFSIVTSNIVTQNPVIIKMFNVKTEGSECIININNNRMGNVSVKARNVDFLYDDSR